MKKIIVSLVVLWIFVFQITLVSANNLTLQLGTIDNLIEDNYDGLSYKKLELTDNQKNKQKIFFASFNPSVEQDYEMVLHHVVDENNNFVGSSVAEIAADYEEKTGRRVVAAVNGDFFIGATPVDYYVNNGDVLHVGPYNWKNSFGFNNDGDTAIGRVNELAYKIKITDSTGVLHEYEVNKYNQEPNEGEIALITPNRMSSVSYQNTAKYLIALDQNRKTDYSFPIRGIAYRLSQGSVVNDDTVSVPTDKVLIAIKGDNAISQFFYNHFKYGNRVEIVQTPKGDFSDLDWVIGGYSILVKDNVLLPKGAHTDNGGDSLAPRTSIGITNSGELFVSVIDGRQAGYSQGITVGQQAQLALDLNAKTALELDGGGSSTFLLRVNDELTVMNQPSDGSLRKVSNAVLITLPATEEEPGDDDVTDPPGNDDDNDDENNDPDQFKDNRDDKGSKNNSMIWIPIVIGVPSLMIFFLYKRRK